MRNVSGATCEKKVELHTGCKYEEQKEKKMVVKYRVSLAVI